MRNTTPARGTKDMMTKPARPLYVLVNAEGTPLLQHVYLLSSSAEHMADAYPGTRVEEYVPKPRRVRRKKA